jgi:hypothetical protein
MRIVDLKQIQQYYGTRDTKGRLCKGGIGQGKETKNLNEVDVLTAHQNIEILNWSGPPWEAD